MTDWNKINKELEREIDGDKRQFWIVLLIMSTVGITIGLGFDRLPGLVKGIFMFIGGVTPLLVPVILRKKNK